MNGNQSIAFAQSGAEPREVRLAFDGSGLDMFGWSVLWLLAFLPFAIPEAWWKRGFCRWMLRHISATDGSKAAFSAKPKHVWFWFPLLWILIMAQHPLRDSAMRLPVNAVEIILGWWVGWRITKWMIAGLELQNGVKFRFTAPPLQYAGWSALIVLSFFTIVGWAWAIIAFLKWVFRHVESDRAELRVLAQPADLLWRGLLVYALPCLTILLAARLSLGDSASLLLDWICGIHSNFDLETFNRGALGLVVLWCLAIPWLMAWMARWLVGNTRLIAKYPAPVVADVPAAI